ncbi:ABC transporter permease [Dyadobacter subterraneus]|uniref:ABC transporter permease n=1 Tax=Dyadobacter subterraneus TaxID=2773304 RepID=A0ABR9WDQ8_9BACT|nr:ABC transporter permease [Dyadobacter subterraneus]MBE9463562.1 ABC transporter permease [Dyadobacter subterraneus]
MKVLGFLLQKEFRQIRRDTTILRIMFMLPIIQLVIFPLAIDFDVKSINISIVDQDHSTYSQKLISKIASSGYFKVVSAETSFKKSLTYIEKGQADLIMEIPAGFERNLVREGVQKIGISVDAINGTKAGIGGQYLNSIITDFNVNIDMNLRGAVAPEQSGAIDITYTNWFNPRAEYKYNVVPAILVLLLTMIGGFVTALNIVKEKEVGTIEQINVTPIKKWEFILGKLIPFWVIGMIVFTLGLTISWLVYGIVPRGSFLTLYSFAAVYLVALLGFGLLISTYSDNQVQAMFVAFFFIMIFILMSGFFTSTDGMPGWAKVISNMTPVAHFVKTDRMIILKGSGFNDVKMEFFYLVGFAAILNGWAIRNYKKTN